MRGPVKAGLVAVGYVGAFLVAAAIVTIHIVLTSGPAWQDASGMYAFGDSLLFLAVFGLAAVPPTGAALFFLRPYRSFWSALSVAALAVAATGVAALIDYRAGRTIAPGSFVDAWFTLAVLWILVAPLFALTFFLAGLFAPNRCNRIVLLMAALIESAVFGYLALIWLQASRSH